MRKALVLLIISTPAWAQSSVNLGYVLDNPLPVLAGVADEDFTEAVGIGAEWKAFDNESAMLQALASGEISLAIGVSPEAFLDGLNANIDLQLIDIAAVYSEQWNCFLRADIAETNAALYGLDVALPFGTGAEIVFEAQMTALGGDLVSSIRHNMASTDAAAAFARAEAEIACADGTALARLRDSGVELLPTDATFALGPRWFSGVVVTKEFATNKPATIVRFLDEQRTLKGDLHSISLAAQMGEIETEAALAGQRQIDLSDKLGPDWFDGGLQAYLTSLAELRAERGMFAGNIAAVAASVNPVFLSGP